MRVPTFARVKFTEENYLTAYMQTFFDELIQNMQEALSDNGWQLPQVTATELTAIAALDPPPRDGTMWYETTSNEVVIKINGALRKVTTTAYP